VACCTRSLQSSNLPPYDPPITPELNDQLIRDILDAAPDGMVIADGGGTIVLVNHQLEALFGYERAELLGMSVDRLLPEHLRVVHREHRHDYADTPRTRAMGAGTALVGRRADGSEFPVEVSLSPVRVDVGTMVVAAVRDITQRLAVDEQLQRVAQDVRVLADRDRIARDLHDTVIQRLFAAGMSLQAASSMAHMPEVSQRLDGVVDELDETIRELRTAIYELHERTIASGGLRQRITQVVTEVPLPNATQPTVRLEGAFDAVPDEHGEQLLAALREALSNVARHARATAVEVAVDAGTELVLLVRDDGVGIGGATTPGNGLANLAARASCLGGSCSVTARPDGGTVVEWWVPAAPA
jgi:two-component system sensor histidine kinase DevS